MCTHTVNLCTHTRTQGHTNSVSISVKLRIKDPVNLARFPCQKQAVCSFAFTGFRRLFFHTLLFPPDNLMSIFFSSGIKTLWTSFSAFVRYEAAQWGWETHTILCRFSVVLPTECPTNYQVQIRSYHSVFAALLWFGWQTCFPLFSFWASDRDGCRLRRVNRSHRWRGEFSNLGISRFLTTDQCVTFVHIAAGSMCSAHWIANIDRPNQHSEGRCFKNTKRKPLNYVQ